MWYVDADLDGFGDPSTTRSECEQPEGMVDQHLDCDDADPTVFWKAIELCDGQSNDCGASLPANESDSDDDLIVAAHEYPAGTVEARAVLAIFRAAQKNAM